MPEKDNKPLTIRFAGRDIDAHDFVDLATQKVVQWMDYQQLQGDERTDFIKSFNEVLQGIVDNRYKISEFGKIMGLPKDPNYYRESDGAKKDGEGAWYNRKRVGFNPYGNVETYLNGIAKLANEYKPEETSGKKTWKNGMLNTLLGNAVFGEGNNQSLTKNTGQLEAWANQYDPYANGTRSTKGRRQFIIDNVLKPYKEDLLAGQYNIDDSTLQSELDAINHLEGNIDNDFELGKMFPLASHYLFTGEKYMTDEQKAAAQLKAKRDAYTSGQADYTDDLGYSAEERTAADQLRQANINKNRINSFNNFNLTGTYASARIYPINKPPKIEADNLNNLLNLPSIDDVLSFHSDGATYYYLINKSKEIGGMFYYPNWKSGDLFVWNKDEKGNMSLQIMDLQSAIRNSQSQNPDLYNYLYESWSLFNGYQVESEKKGGILKGAQGIPGIDPEEETITSKPQAAADTKLPIYLTGPKKENSDLPIYVTGPNKPSPWYDNDSPYAWRHQVSTTPTTIPAPAPAETSDELNTEVPDLNETGRRAKNWKTKAKSDYMIDGLAFVKSMAADFYNQRILDKMTSLQAVHKVPLRKEYLIHTSKPIEDAIANNNADFNQLGATQAAGTSDQGDAFARRLVTEKAKHDANTPLVAKQAEMVQTQADKALENENANFANLYEVGEANHAADVALYNYNKQQEAEYYSRQGRQRIAQLTEQQRGIAESAQRNFEREKEYAVYNNPEYKALEEEYDGYYEKLLAVNQKLSADPSNEQLKDEKNLLTSQMRMCEYKKAMLQKKILATYDAENITPYGFVWGLPGTIYQQVPSNPVRSRREGGKMEYAEKEKTRRMYAKMLFDMMKMDMNHMYKQNRDAYKDYRKIFMQQSK